MEYFFNDNDLKSRSNKTGSYDNTTGRRKRKCSNNANTVNCHQFSRTHNRPCQYVCKHVNYGWCYAKTTATTTSTTTATAHCIHHAIENIENRTVECTAIWRCLVETHRCRPANTTAARYATCSWSNQYYHNKHVVTASHKCIHCKQRSYWSANWRPVNENSAGTNAGPAEHKPTTRRGSK